MASESAQIPWFDSVFADIGDEQSLAQSLSTFSGHLKQISVSEIFCLEAFSAYLRRYTIHYLRLNMNSGAVLTLFSKKAMKCISITIILLPPSQCIASKHIRSTPGYIQRRNTLSSPCKLAQL